MRPTGRHGLFALILALHVGMILVLMGGLQSGLHTGFRLSSQGVDGDLLQVVLDSGPSEPARSAQPAPDPVRPLAHRPAVHRADTAPVVNNASARTEGAAALASSFAVAGVSMSDYSRELLAHIEHNKRYPPTAGFERPRGVVRVQFKLSRNGSVLGVWVQSSSGSAALDREAVATLLRGQPLPPIPDGLPDPMDFSFDIEFSPPAGALSG